jgi:hypothetical protein
MRANRQCNALRAGRPARRQIVRRVCLPIAAASSTAIAPASAASTTTATAAKSAAATSSTSTAAAGPTAISRRARFVNHDASSFELLPVQRLNGALGFFIILNFNKAEATGLACEAVPDQHDAGRSYAGLREPFSDFFFGSLKRKIPDVKFLH